MSRAVDELLSNVQTAVQQMCEDMHDAQADLCEMIVQRNVLIKSLHAIQQRACGPLENIAADMWDIAQNALQHPELLEREALDSAISQLVGETE